MELHHCAPLKVCWCGLKVSLCLFLKKKKKKSVYCAKAKPNFKQNQTPKTQSGRYKLKSSGFSWEINFEKCFWMWRSKQFYLMQ